MAYASCFFCIFDIAPSHQATITEIKKPFNQFSIILNIHVIGIKIYPQGVLFVAQITTRGLVTDFVIGKAIFMHDPIGLDTFRRLASIEYKCFFHTNFLITP